MAIVTTKIGPISAYVIAKEEGYTGTKEQFAQEIGNAAANAQAAAASATAAEGSAASAATSASNAMSTTPTGYNSMMASIAAEYDASAGVYAVGDYCRYNSEVYRCVAAVTVAEAFDSGKWTKVTVGGEVSRVTGALDPMGILPIEFLYKDRYYKTDEGSVDVDTTVDGTGYYDCTWVACAEGDKFTVSGTTSLASGGGIRSAIWTFIASDGTVLAQEAELQVVNKIITAPANAAKLVLNNRYRDQTITPGFYYGSRLQEINNELEERPKGHLGKNLFYGIPLMEGYYLNSATELKASATYTTTGYIDVSGYTYRTKEINGVDVTARWVSISPRIRMWAEYKADMTPNTGAADSGYHNTGAQKLNASEMIDSNTVYIRVTLYSADLSIVQIEDNDVCTTYEAPQLVFDEIYGLNEHQKGIVETIASSNLLYGKKWAVCGDSFTAGVTSGTLPDGMYAGQKIVYPYIIGNRNDMIIYNFFYSGRTLAYPEVPDGFTNSLTNPTADFYYQNIPSDADYITIYLGINDEHHAPGSSAGDGETNNGKIPLGDPMDGDPDGTEEQIAVGTTTYYGAWNTVLSWLIENRPNAHIGIIVTNGIAPKDEYRQAQIAMATKYGIPYIDLNGDGRTPAMLRTSNPNIPDRIKTELIEKWRVSADNLHPNNAAHQFESTFIEAFLRGL